MLNFMLVVFIQDNVDSLILVRNVEVGCQPRYPKMHIHVYSLTAARSCPKLVSVFVARKNHQPIRSWMARYGGIQWDLIICTTGLIQEHSCWIEQSMSINTKLDCSNLAVSQSYNYAREMFVVIANCVRQIISLQCRIGTIKRYQHYPNRPSYSASAMRVWLVKTLLRFFIWRTRTRIIMPNLTQTILFLRRLLTIPRIFLNFIVICFSIGNGDIISSRCRSSRWCPSVRR